MVYGVSFKGKPALKPFRWRCLLVLCWV